MEAKDTPTTPEGLREYWKGELSNLPKLSFTKTKETLCNPRFHPRIPPKVMTAEGFTELFSILQNLRSDFIEEWYMTIMENYERQAAAIRSMRTMMIGMSEGKNKENREADVEAWIIHQQSVFDKTKALKIMADMVLQNIDSALNQLNRQYRAVETSYRASLLDPSIARDVDEAWGDEVPESVKRWTTQAGVVSTTE